MTLDAEIVRRWDEAAAAGALRTHVDETHRRRLAGDLAVVVQFNEAHRREKRPVDKALMAVGVLAKPARPAFDFTQAKAIEFLGGLAFEAESPALIGLEGDSVDAFRHQADNVVLVNVAPLMHGHFLVLLDWTHIRPQQLSFDLLAKGIQVTQAMDRGDFALGFNSAGAWSSVNHFHFQGFFFPADVGAADMPVANFPVTSQPRRELFRKGSTVSACRLPRWPLISYAVELLHDEDGPSTHLDDLAAQSWELVQVLQKHAIPHNILIAKTSKLVVWVFPRQPQREHHLRMMREHGISKDSGNFGQLRFAIAEVAGLVVAGDDTTYQKLDEDAFVQILRDEVSIEKDVAELVEKEWRAAAAET